MPNPLTLARFASKPLKALGHWLRPAKPARDALRHLRSGAPDTVDSLLKETQQLTAAPWLTGRGYGWDSQASRLSNLARNGMNALQGAGRTGLGYYAGNTAESTVNPDGTTSGLGGTAGALLGLLGPAGLRNSRFLGRGFQDRGMSTRAVMEPLMRLTGGSMIGDLGDQAAGALGHDTGGFGKRLGAGIGLASGFRPSMRMLGATGREAVQAGNASAMNRYFGAKGFQDFLSHGRARDLAEMGSPFRTMLTPRALRGGASVGLGAGLAGQMVAPTVQQMALGSTANTEAGLPGSGLIGAAEKLKNTRDATERLYTSEMVESLKEQLQPLADELYGRPIPLTQNGLPTPEAIELINLLLNAQ